MLRPLPECSIPELLNRLAMASGETNVAISMFIAYGPTQSLIAKGSRTAAQNLFDCVNEYNAIAEQLDTKLNEAFKIKKSGPRLIGDNDK